MKNPLGPNWKPRLAGIMTVFVPPVLFAALTNYAHMSAEQATQYTGEVMTFLVAAGFAVAKAHDVSNSPTPMPCPRQVDAPPDPPKDPAKPPAT